MDAKDELMDELDLLPAWRLSKMNCSQLDVEKERLTRSVFKQVAKISHEYKAMLTMYADLVAEYQTKNCVRNVSEGEGQCRHCAKLQRD